MASGTTTAGKELSEQKAQQPLWRRPRDWPPGAIDWLTGRKNEDPLSDPNRAFGELKEDKYKAELQLVDRYQSFVGELLRLSLLGIAVFGFLYTNQIFQGLPTWGESIAKALAILSIVAFGVSAGCALAFRFFAAEAASKYIEALRFPPHNKRAEESLHTRMQRVYYARATKLFSAVMLGVGGLLVAGCVITLVFASTPAASTAEQIEDLDDLRNRGVITEADFKETKDRLLARL